MSLLRKGILEAGGSATVSALTLVTNVFLARELLPDGMGRVRMPIEVGTFVTSIWCLGLGQASIFFINGRKVELSRVVTNTFWLVAVMGSVLSVGLAFAYMALDSFIGELPVFTCVGLAVGMTALFGMLLFRPILIAKYRVRESVLAQVLDAAMLFLTVAACFLVNAISVDIALLAVAAGHVCGLLFLVYQCRSDIDFKRGFDFSLFREMLVHGQKLFVSNTVTLASTSMAFVLLRHFVKDNFNVVGFFGRAISLASMVRLVAGAAGQLLYAKWSEVTGAVRAAQVEQALRIHIISAALVAIPLFLLGNRVMVLLYGVEFAPAVGPLYLLVICEMIMTRMAIYAMLWAGDGRPLMVAFFYGGIIPLLTIGMFAFVPGNLDSAGLIAAGSLLCASATMLAVTTVMTSRVHGLGYWRSIGVGVQDFRYLYNAILSRSKAA